MPRERSAFWSRRPLRFEALESRRLLSVFAVDQAGDSPDGTRIEGEHDRSAIGDVGVLAGAPFTDIDAGLPGVNYSSAAWGDYDNDGDLDILLSGEASGGPISRVYRNDGGTFTDIGAGLPGVRDGSAAWGDYDNDGDLDILLTGRATETSSISRVYRNDGGTFTDVSVGLAAVFYSSVAWGDYDNDGDLDILLTGFTGPGGISRVYRNDGGTFTDISAGLPGVYHSSVAWGDYDNDGDLDILLTGRTTEWNSISRVYRNDGGTFTDIAAGLPGVWLSSAAWGDYDNDGDLDILLTGWTGSKRISRLYRNDGGTFTDIAAGLPGVGLSSAAWGDYDNDGDLDILLTGDAEGSLRTSRVYNNDGGVFTDVSAALWEVDHSSVAWGDYDNDGNLDILLTGSYISRVYRNHGTTLTEVSVGLPGVDLSSVAWGDYDNDGDLDILLTGRTDESSSISRVYRNDSGTFADISAGLPGVYIGSVAWGDYDNDGDLDILLTGSSESGKISRVYRNDGGMFTDISAGLPGVYQGSVAWGDYDNDGDLDILLTGRTDESSSISEVYRNDSGTFTDISAGLPGVKYSSAAWGDYDNDGDLDILLTGSDASGDRISRVYRNDGGAFTDISAGLPGAYYSSVAWGDYDNDGDLDILLTGYASGGLISRVYRNDGGTFTDIDAGLPGVYHSSVAWGDYDNDGDLDILLTGWGDSSGISRVFRNDGGTFNDAGARMPGVYGSSAAWRDYDNDGDLDILLTGWAIDESSPISRVYRNDGQTFNEAPSAPTGLAAAAGGPTSATLSWTAPADNPPTPGGTATPSAGLSYNLRVGTTPGACDVLAPMSFAGTSTPPDGLRKLPQRGPIQGTSWTLTDLVPGATYYWSVQAVDTALAGGPFATEGSFTTPQFTDIDADLPGVYLSSVAWGDYDNDGDLDILLTGEASGGYISRVYRNDGGTFTDVDAGLLGVRYGSAAWGDYDNDGDLDILLRGDTGSIHISWLYRNDGGTFVEFDAGLPFVQYSSAAWGDYDNDGDLDILLTGTPMTSRVYRNDGGTFTDIGAGLSDLDFGSAAWGDYDNDGDLDILMMGYSNIGLISRVYRNDGGTFTDIGAGLTGVNHGSAAWGDYDNDGDLDIFLTGNSYVGLISRVYRNDGGTFAEVSAGLPRVGYGSAAWGDYDNDGDLDILLTGGTGSGPISRVYRNDGATFNQAPGAPTGLAAAVNGPTSATLSWTAPADNPPTPGGTPTPSDGLSYNLRVGTAPGAGDVVGPMSFDGTTTPPDGLRKLPQRGPIQATSWTLTDLTPGATYYWSVQAVDTALAGSPFATEGSFDTPPIDTENPTVIIHEVLPDPRTTVVHSVLVEFSEPVTGVNIWDFTLTRNGSEVLDLFDALLTPLSPSLYELDLSDRYVTGSGGEYELTLNAAGSGIEDLAGNDLLSGDSDDWTMNVTNIRSHGWTGHIFLTIEDNAPGGQDEELAISVAGTDLVITSDNVVLLSFLSWATQVSDYRVEVPLDYFHEIEVFGKGGADTLTVDLAGGMPIPADGLTFDAGDGSDTAVIHGSDADESATLRPGSGEVSVNGMPVSLVSTESITFDAGDGSDTAVIHGSDADESAALRPGSGELSGDGMMVSMLSTESITVHSGGGSDMAKLYDSPGDDMLIINPDEASLTGPGYSNQVVGFGFAMGIARVDGYDTAKLDDSLGEDVFLGTPTYSKMSTGGETYAYAKSFEHVIGYSRAGGSDLAILKDSPGDDKFVGRSTYGKLSGPGFKVQAQWFGALEACANSTGDDRAYLFDSPGDDWFIGDSKGAVMQGVGFRNRARWFESTYGYGTAGGMDRAIFYDSPGNDTFVGTATRGRLTGPGYFLQAVRFDVVRAFSQSGGQDKARLFDSAGDDLLVATPEYSYLRGSPSSGNFRNRADGFAEVEATARFGGDDTARLYDSALNDYLHAEGNSAVITWNAARVLAAYDFDQVKADGSKGGVNLLKKVPPLDYLLTVTDPLDWTNL